MSTLLAMALIVVSALGMIAAPLIIYVTGPGFVATPDKFAVTVATVAPYLSLYPLHLPHVARRRYPEYLEPLSVPAFTPTLLNVSFIVFALWLRRISTRLFWLWLGPCLRAAAATWVSSFRSWQDGMLPRLRFDPKDPGVLENPEADGARGLRSLDRSDQPAHQHLLLPFLVTGSVSWLYYADRLMEFPTDCSGVALVRSCCQA